MIVLTYIFNLINMYGLYIIFIVIILEYSCFPIPSEVVLPLAGAIGYSHQINPFIMVIFSVMAGLAGSLICYLIGYFTGKTFFRKKKEETESITFYKKYGNLAISVGRIIPLCRTYISFIAGINKHKFLPYIFFSTIGICIWNTCLILLGYLFYDNIEIVAIFYKKYKYFILALLFIIFFLYLFKKRKIIKNKITKHEQI